MRSLAGLLAVPWPRESSFLCERVFLYVLHVLLSTKAYLFSELLEILVTKHFTMMEFVRMYFSSGTWRPLYVTV